MTGPFDRYGRSPIHSNERVIANQGTVTRLYILYLHDDGLRLIGLSRERLAVRLALTLHYAEVVMLRGKGNWQDTLNGLFEPHDEAARQMELPLYRFGIGDVLLLGLALLLLWGALR